MELGKEAELLAREPRDLPVSASAVLGGQARAITPSFFTRLLMSDQAQILMLARQTLSWLSCLPRPAHALLRDKCRYSR